MGDGLNTLRYEQESGDGEVLGQGASAGPAAHCRLFNSLRSGACLSCALISVSGFKYKLISRFRLR